MRFLRNGFLGILPLVFGFVVIGTPKVEAQLFEGKLPRIFNREREDTGPTPITRDTPDIVFIRDYGTPTPYSTKIQTVKGHQVSFYIYAKTKTPGMRVEFLVRQFPSAGKLISIISNQENRSSAEVTYIADPNSGATMDAFTFAARYPGGKYSSVARCSIEIKDAQALIEVTPTAEFGKLLVGEKQEREIKITNRGNAPYSTTLNLPPPWKVVSPGKGKLQLSPGSQENVVLEYKPTFGGPSNYDLILNRGEKGTCKLAGEAVVPFYITGEEWELKVNPETGRREGDVIVKSNHTRPFEVFLRSSERLKVKTSEFTVLLPEKENRIHCYLEEDDVMAFDGGLEIKMKQGFKEVTSVFANTVPANLVVDVPGQLGHEVINFGKVTAGRSAERGILLKNKGGELMPLDVSVSEPFRVLTNTDRQLVPMESLPISIGFYPHKSDRGAADQMLTLRTHRQEVKIRLVGNSLRPPGAPRDRSSLVAAVTPPPKPADTPDPDPSSATVTPQIGNSAKSPGVSSPDRLKPDPAPPSIDFPLGNTNSNNLDDVSVSPLGIVTRGIVARELAPGLKSAEDFELLNAKARLLQFGWTAPKGSEIDEFELEMRGQRINPVTSALESVWAPYPGVEYERIGRLVKATVPNLDPFAYYEFRVFTIDQNGRCSPPSLAFGARTTRTMDWTYIYAGLGVILLGFLVWAIRKIFLDRRGEVYRSEFVT
ncbi:MAG: hypothetical protein P1V20_29330 [Verrucomicrobiales bacterium]|nr:hypothetical protein [Verrucomicrobiales bacterium]